MTANSRNQAKPYLEITLSAWDGHRVRADTRLTTYDGQRVAQATVEQTNAVHLEFNPSELARQTDKAYRTKLQEVLRPLLNSGALPSALQLEKIRVRLWIKDSAQPLRGLRWELLATNAADDSEQTPRIPTDASFARYYPPHEGTAPILPAFREKIKRGNSTTETDNKPDVIGFYVKAPGRASGQDSRQGQGSNSQGGEPQETSTKSAWENKLVALKARTEDVPQILALGTWISWDESGPSVLFERAADDTDASSYTHDTIRKPAALLVSSLLALPPEKRPGLVVLASWERDVLQHDWPQREHQLAAPLAIGYQLAAAGIPATLVLPRVRNQAALTNYVSTLAGKLESSKSDTLEEAVWAAHGRDSSHEVGVPVLIMATRGSSAWNYDSFYPSAQSKIPTAREVVPIIGPEYPGMLLAKSFQALLKKPEVVNLPLARQHVSDVHRIGAFLASKKRSALYKTMFALWLDTLLQESALIAIWNDVQKADRQLVDKELSKFTEGELERALLLLLARIRGLLEGAKGPSAEPGDSPTQKTQKVRANHEPSLRDGAVQWLRSTPYYELARRDFKVIFTTDPTSLLEIALRHVGKEPLTQIFPYPVVWDHLFQYQKQKQNDADSTQVFVIHLCGHLWDPPTLILTESDLIEQFVLFKRVRSNLMKNIGTELAARQLAFLGFDTDTWLIKFILSGVFGQFLAPQNEHPILVAVSAAEDRYVHSHEAQAYLEGILQEQVRQLHPGAPSEEDPAGTSTGDSAAKASPVAVPTSPPSAGRSPASDPKQAAQSGVAVPADVSEAPAGQEGGPAPPSTSGALKLDASKAAETKASLNQQSYSINLTVYFGPSDSFVAKLPTSVSS